MAAAAQISFQMRIDKVYQDAGVWKGDVSGPMDIYPADGLLVVDTSEIPEPEPPPTLTAIDNVDPKLAYAGTWFNGPTTAPGFYGNTMAYSNIAGNSMTLIFNGTSIEVFCEKKVGHGSGTFQIDAQAAQTINLGVAGPVGSTSVFKVENLSAGQHTFKLTVVGPSYVVFDYIKINGTAVTPIPPIPPAGDIVVQPGQSIKAAVEAAASGKTVQLLAGLYSENLINVPVGVSIVGAGKNQTTIEFTGTHPQQSETGIFQLKSSSQANGNQTISGFTIRGKFLANGGIIVDKRDNVKITDILVRDTTYFGGWLKNTTGSEFSYSELYNSSWASVAWVTGEICVHNITNTLIHHNYIHTDRSDKGYGIKALWPDGTITTSKFYSNIFQMTHFSLWNNGVAPNIDIELHNTFYAGIEIYDNDFSTMGCSLAGHKATKSGRVIVRNNRFVWSSTAHIEVVCSNLTIEANTFSGAPMMTANFQPNGKWIDIIVNNNDFTSSGTNPSWGGTHLIGANGMDMTITNNTYNNLGGYTFVKHMGAPANSVIVDTGNTKNQ